MEVGMSHTETEPELAVEATETAEAVEATETAEAVGATETEVEVAEATPVIEFPDPPQTGDAEVDEAITAVAVAVQGPLEDQLAVYEAAHRTLQDRLADVEG
jgi:hypothetical protein